jgi:uncharacterized protein YcfL
MLMLPVLLLLAGCSGLQNIVAPSASLVPKPVPISAEIQDSLPRLMDTLAESGETVSLSRSQADMVTHLLILLHIEREKMRAARSTLSE